jgi:hypothetical protein
MLESQLQIPRGCHDYLKYSILKRSSPAMVAVVGTPRCPGHAGCKHFGGPSAGKGGSKWDIIKVGV